MAYGVQGVYCAMLWSGLDSGGGGGGGGGGGLKMKMQFDHA